MGRTNAVSVYMSESERERARRVATRAGLTLSQWIYDLVLEELRNSEAYARKVAYPHETMPGFVWYPDPSDPGNRYVVSEEAARADGWEIANDA